MVSPLPGSVIGTPVLVSAASISLTVALGFLDLSTATGEETKAMLTELHETVIKSVELTVQALRDTDQRAAESVMMLKDSVREQSERLLARKAERLTADDPEYLTLVRLQMAFVDHMRRIYTLAKRITKDILPPALAMSE